MKFKNVVILLLLILSTRQHLISNQNKAYFKRNNFMPNKMEAEIACREGEKFMNEKKYLEAYNSFSKAIKLFPCSKYYCKRGACLIVQQKNNEASTDFDNALKIDSSCSEAYFFKGIICQSNADSFNAIANYTKSIEINPNNSDAYLMRGILYGTLNKEKEGCEDLNKAARMGNQKAIEQKNKLCK